MADPKRLSAALEPMTDAELVALSDERTSAGLFVGQCPVCFGWAGCRRNRDGGPRWVTIAHADCPGEPVACREHMIADCRECQLQDEIDDLLAELDATRERLRAAERVVEATRAHVRAVHDVRASICGRAEMDDQARAFMETEQALAAYDKIRKGE